MKTFDIKTYFQKLDSTEDPLAKILLKREFKQYVNSLPKKEKMELDKQESEYFNEKIIHYQTVIGNTKLQMKELGIEV